MDVVGRPDRCTLVWRCTRAAWVVFPCGDRGTGHPLMRGHTQFFTSNRPSRELLLGVGGLLRETFTRQSQRSTPGREDAAKSRFPRAACNCSGYQGEERCIACKLVRSGFVPGRWPSPSSRTWPATGRADKRYDIDLFTCIYCGSARRSVGGLPLRRDRGLHDTTWENPDARKSMSRDKLHGGIGGALRSHDSAGRSRRPTRGSLMFPTDSLLCSPRCSSRIARRVLGASTPLRACSGAVLTTAPSSGCLLDAGVALGIVLVWSLRRRP